MPESITKNPTLLWTIAGVALALLALAAISQGGSSSTTTSSGGGGGISATDLVAETNQYNADATAVEESLIGAQQSVINNTIDNATQQIGLVENAQTARYQTATAGYVSEYQTEANAITSQIEGFQGLQATRANDNAAIQISQNQEQAVQSASMWSGIGNIFGSALGMLGGFFSLGGGGNPVTVGAPSTSSFSALNPSTWNALLNPPTVPLLSNLGNGSLAENTGDF
jgi:uncharacterized surface protein with fasciclin (FAS1) repeats